MTGFLDLPPEIRDMVYKCCLLTRPGIVITPFVKPYQEADGLYPTYCCIESICFALFSVSKVVSLEARTMFYGCNTFRIATFARFPGDLPDNDIWYISNFGLFRHVHIDLDMRDFHLSDCVTLAGLHSASVRENTDNDMKHRHTMNRRHLFRKWRLTLHTVANMNLTSLTVDMSNAMCSIGCCRLGMNLLPDQVQTTLTKFELKATKTGTGSSHRLAKLLFSIYGAKTAECPSVSRVKIVGMSDKQEIKHAHFHGFGCHMCPLKGDDFDIGACNREAIWKAEQEQVEEEDDPDELMDADLDFEDMCNYHDYYNAASDSDPGELDPEEE